MASTTQVSAPLRSLAMAAAVASPVITPVAPAKSADFDYLRYQDKIKEYVVKVTLQQLSYLTWQPDGCKATHHAHVQVE